MIVRKHINSTKICHLTFAVYLTRLHRLREALQTGVAARYNYYTLTVRAIWESEGTEANKICAS